MATFSSAESSASVQDKKVLILNECYTVRGTLPHGKEISTAGAAVELTFIALFSLLLGRWLANGKVSMDATEVQKPKSVSLLLSPVCIAAQYRGMNSPSYHIWTVIAQHLDPAFLAKCVIYLCHHRAALAGLVLSKGCWLWKVTHEPQDDVPHCYWGLEMQKTQLDVTGSHPTTCRQLYLHRGRIYDCPNPE